MLPTSQNLISSSNCLTQQPSENSFLKVHVWKELALIHTHTTFWKRFFGPYRSGTPPWGVQDSTIRSGSSMPSYQLGVVSENFIKFETKNQKNRFLHLSENKKPSSPSEPKLIYFFLLFLRSPSGRLRCGIFASFFMFNLTLSPPASSLGDVMPSISFSFHHI